MMCRVPVPSCLPAQFIHPSKIKRHARTQCQPQKTHPIQIFQQRVAQTIQRLALDAVDAQMQRRASYRPTGQFGVVQPIGEGAVVSVLGGRG